MSIEEFRIRKDPRFWADLPSIVTDWDRMIEEFNGADGSAGGGVSISPRPLPSALVCAGCGASPEPDDPYPFRCPGAGAGDDADHVLRRILDVSAVQFPTTGEEHGDRGPYVRYRRLFHSYHVARAGGIEDAEYCDLVARLDGQVSKVDGHGFRSTPFGARGRPQRATGFRGGRRGVGQG